MEFGAEASIFLAYALGILAVYFFGKVFLVPLKILLKLLVGSLLGGLALLIINAAGSSIGIMVPLNLLTAGIAGILGFPGVVCLVIYFNSIF